MSQTEKDMYTICITLLLASFFALIFLTSQGHNILGFSILEEFESNFTYQQPGNIGRETALQALIGAEQEIKNLKESGLSTYYINDLLIEAKKAYVGNNLALLAEEVRAEQDEEKKAYKKSLLDRSLLTEKESDLNEVFRLTQLISYTKKKAYTLIDAIALLEEKEAEYKKQGIDTTETLELIGKAKKSFNEERYDESENLIREADSKLETSKTELVRVKKLVEMSKGFFIRNWPPILIALLVITILTPITIKNVKLKIAENKLETLKLEKETVTKLMKKVQEDRFNKGELSESIYNIRMEKYKDDLARINRTIPVLEAMLEKKKKEAKPKKEEEGIIKVKK